MGWSVLDLSSISDDLLQLLRDAVKAGSDAWAVPNGTGTIDFFHVDVSGAMPEADREEAHGCLLSLYLLHAGPDPYFRSWPTKGKTAQTNVSQPLSLNLYFLLSAYAKKNYNHEQQAMSIAMRCFHENAIVQRAASLPHEPDGAEYTITMEVQSADEMSRLWQALSTPLRLAVVYKVSVVFVTPTKAPRKDQPAPSAVAMAVSPMGTPGLPTRLFGAAVRDSFYVPDETKGDGTADAVATSVIPGLVRIGDTLVVSGTGLDASGYDNVYLTPLGGAESDVTAWRIVREAGDFRLKLPKDATAPAPGLYGLTVGSGTVRSGAIPLTVSARVDGPTQPPVIVPGVGGVYTMSGAGFVPVKTQMFFGDTELTKVAGPPGAGEFAVDGTGNTVTFQPPAAAAPGQYYPLIRVNGVDTPPSWFVVLP